MSLTAAIIEDSWSDGLTWPTSTGTQARLWTRTTGATLTVDEFRADGSGSSVGDTFTSGTRSGYVQSVKLRQAGPRAVREALTISNDPPAINWGSTSVQSTHPDQAGYVNADLRAVRDSGTWWRYGSPDDFCSATDTPWETATPSETMQCILEGLQSKAVDLSGVPMTFPMPQEEVNITLSWESASAISAFRSTWATNRFQRNDTALWGYDVGTLLFDGVGYRMATGSEMPVSDLRFIHCPYGWCRQRAISAPNGDFTKDYVYTSTADPPGADTCSGGDYPAFRHAKYVYWVQLFPTLGGFDDLFTTEQYTKLGTLLG
jgi:hypothetical protein